MSKAFSVFGIIITTFVLYLFILFTVELVTMPLTGKAVQSSNDSATIVKFKLATSSDILELRENFGDVITALTQANIPELLSGGSIQTDSGATEYNQYIRFEDESRSIDGLIVNFTEDEKVSDYLFVDNGNNASDAIFEYKLEFEEGLESDVTSDNKLEDFEEATLNILGRRFRVTNTKIDTTTNELTIDLVDAVAVSTISEGEKKTINVNGRDYEVEVVIITDSNTPEIKLRVNGEDLKTIREGEGTTFGNNTLVIVDDVLSGEAGESSKDSVDVFIDAYKISLRDSDYTDTTFIQGFKVNENTIEDGFVSIIGNEISTSEFEISSINYRLISQSELYIEKGESLRKFLKENGGMMTEYWDIVYEGLSSPEKAPVKFEPIGEDRYKLEFLNKKDIRYIFPLMNNRGTYNLGDENGNNFTFIEGSNTSDYTVTDDDYFILTNKNDKNGYTSVFQYNSIDTSTQTLTFNDLSGSTKQTTYTLSNVSGRLGEADLSSDGVNYRIYIADSAAASYPLAIDLTADGSLNSGEANIVVKGGGLLDLGTTNNPTGNFTITLTTERSQLDEASSDETVSWTMERRTGNEVGIGDTFSGLSLETEDDHKFGMTVYGSYFDVFDESNARAETMTIEYPAEQVSANVYLTVNIPSKVSAVEKVEEKEEVVEEEKIEIKNETKTESKPVEAPKVQQPTTAAKPIQRVQKPSKGSLLVPIMLVLIILIILVAVGVIVYSKGKPKEPSVFDGYLVR